MDKYIFGDILLFFSLKKFPELTEHLKVLVYSMFITQGLYFKKSHILFAYLNANLK